jgi:transcriptional regulator with XRE-family HTH domain
MPKQVSHPVVQSRILRGLSQTDVAERAFISRSSLIAIEEGRTRTLKKQTAIDLERVLLMPVGALQSAMDRWFAERNPRDGVTNAGRALLGATPSALAYYETFRNWRKLIAPSVTAFASLIGVNRALVDGYEKGIRDNGMSVTLMHHIQTALQLSPEYVRALSELEPS